MFHKIQTVFEKSFTGITGTIGGILLSLQAQIELLQVMSLTIGILIGSLTLVLKIKQLIKKEEK